MEPQSFEAIPGYGITAMVTGRGLLIGNRRLMAEHNVDTGALDKSVDELEMSGKNSLRR